MALAERTKRVLRIVAIAGPFLLMLRLYQPTETPPSILDGSWKIPVVKKSS